MKDNLVKLALREKSSFHTKETSRKPRVYTRFPPSFRIGNP